MILSVFWGPKSCEILDCGQAFAESLRAVAEYFPSLDAWFEKGSPKPDLTKRVSPDDLARICELLKSGQNRNDCDGGVIHELGYRVGLWNGNRSSGSTVSVQCGATSTVVGIKNSFVLETPTILEDVTDKEVDLLEKLVSIWGAESGRIFELSVLQSGDVSEEVFLEIPDRSI